MAQRPLIHGDRCGSPRVEGAGGAVLGDGDQLLAAGDHRLGQARALRSEDQAAGLRKRCRFQRHRTREVVDSDHGQPFTTAVLGQSLLIGAVDDVQIAVGHHRTATVPATVSDDVHEFDIERVGGTHDRADVEVVLPVLDGDLQARRGDPRAAGIEIVDDGVHPPVAVAVDDVAAVAVGQQRGVEARVLGPRLWVGPDSDVRIGRVRCRFVGHRSTAVLGAITDRGPRFRRRSGSRARQR
ncbi:hypothetical protein SDC9_101914 [bioreactor metagenome]|uniref:Uncharacterized protein n=1 Tax=bioreactor metagenome TaxID=1076179 RepID=A0A645AQE3_9ZZZZ